MTQAPSTVVLHSRSHTALSLELNTQHPRANMSLRRRTASLFVNVPPYGVVDVCVLTGKNVEEAQAIIADSPQVHKMARRGLLTWYTR